MIWGLFKTLIKHMIAIMIIGFVIWNRFTRDIPDLLLTEYIFWILLYICCIYFYIAKNLYVKSSYKPYVIFLFIFIPRFIMIFFLCLDIFCFHHIALFYNFILLGLFPLIYRYLKFSLKSIYEYHVNLLDENYAKVRIFQEDFKDEDVLLEAKQIARKHLIMFSQILNKDIKVLIIENIITIIPWDVYIKTYAFQVGDYSFLEYLYNKSEKELYLIILNRTKNLNI